MSISEIRLHGPRNSSVVIGDGTDVFVEEFDFTYFTVTIVGQGLSARVDVCSVERDTPGSFHQFLQELADDWKGLEPERSWESVEQELTVEARRDPVGHVVLTFTPRESYHPDAWLAGATVQLDAGEEMASLAAAFKRLLPK